MPKAVPTTPYQTALARARVPLEAAYQDAIKAYTKAKMDSEADMVARDLKGFQDSSPILRLRPMVVAFVGKPAAGWALREARAGTVLFSDRGYKIGDLSKDLAGGTLFVRGSGENRNWLKEKTIVAQNDGNLHVLVRWKFNGREELDAATLAKFAEEGWEELSIKFISSPKGEDWQWKIFQKGIKKGEIDLPLSTTKLCNVPVLFIFK
jgi:hypothetical protein